MITFNDFTLVLIFKSLQLMPIPQYDSSGKLITPLSGSYQTHPIANLTKT
jgi:hypothetical protein